MSKLLINTSDLNFGFEKDKLILRNLNMNVEEGAIYGFLGPNGAGKTTTIRLLLGLLRPMSGHIEVLDKSWAQDPMTTYAEIGALIETPSLYLHLSGFDNLNITRKVRNLSSSRVDEVLELVNLKYASSMLVKKYSLGMKQRLGIALALLSRPRLLILDEPTNGLDPNGMIETRELLTDLNKASGVTLVISSHLLSEVEKLITHVGIIKQGEMVFQGPLEKLEEIRHPQSIVQVSTSDNGRAMALLQSRYATKLGSRLALEFPFENNDQVATICQSLVNHGLSVYRLQVMHDDLESKFFEIIKD